MIKIKSLGTKLPRFKMLALQLIGFATLGNMIKIFFYISLIFNKGRIISTYFIGCEADYLSEVM